MIAEPILAFFLVWYFRKILRRSAALPELDRPLRLAMFALTGIFILQVVFSIEPVTVWIWHIIILLLIAVAFKLDEFRAARNMVVAFLPLFIVSVLKDIIKLLPDRVNEIYGRYLNNAVPFSVIWMIVMLIIFNKQRKALEKEHKKAQDEEEQKKIAEARKAELEVLVAERTAEITQQKNELEHALVELKNTQSQLIQSEKMASLGALTAGIAHEIQNPLNFVNNFSEVNNELIDELKNHLALGETKLKSEEQDELLNHMFQNNEKIAYHGKRADAIVKAMLQHSRISTGQKEPTDINALVDEYLRLSYHGLRAKDKTFNAKFEIDLDERLSAGKNGVGKINIVPQDIGRVLLNLFNNAFYAVIDKKKTLPDLQSDKAYEPTVFVSTKKIDGKVEITIRDNGNGIPQTVFDKIFQPFFTTKPPGEGTGLGLSLSYDIVKAHGGEIRVETLRASTSRSFGQSEAGEAGSEAPGGQPGEIEGTEFIIQLPAQENIQEKSLS